MVLDTVALPEPLRHALGRRRRCTFRALRLVTSHERGGSRDGARRMRSAKMPALEHLDALKRRRARFNSSFSPTVTWVHEPRRGALRFVNVRQTTSRLTLIQGSLPGPPELPLGVSWHSWGMARVEGELPGSRQSFASIWPCSGPAGAKLLWWAELSVSSPGHVSSPGPGSRRGDKVGPGGRDCEQ